jgi:hypothetical protein
MCSRVIIYTATYRLVTTEETERMSTDSQIAPSVSVTPELTAVEKVCRRVLHTTRESVTGLISADLR